MESNQELVPNFDKLKILKDWLENNKESIKFDMRYYRKRPTGNYLYPCNFYSKTNCGTVGCLLGHAPLIEGLEPDEDLFKKVNFDEDKFLSWKEYSLRVFNIKDQTRIWHFLFSSYWFEFNNTVEGAIDRLNFVINNKDLINEDFFTLPHTVMTTNEGDTYKLYDKTNPYFPKTTTFDRWLRK